MIPIIILAIVVLLVVIWAISISNRFKVLLVKIDEADAGIDVALIKRYDTLTKLMEVVRAYAKHEADMFREVIQLRSGMGMTDRQEAHKRMDETLDRINVVAEAYPELRSSENYRQLQDAIVEAEDHLQAARRVYNMNVSSFNQSIAVFPGSVIAGRQKYRPKEYFEVDADKKADVKIKL